MPVTRDECRRELRWCAKLVLRALLLAGLFGMLHVLGWRQYTCVFSGTTRPTTAEAVMATAYVISYLLCVAVAPVLVFAALFWGGLWWMRRKASR